MTAVERDTEDLLSEAMRKFSSNEQMNFEGCGFLRDLTLN